MIWHHCTTMFRKRRNKIPLPDTCYNVVIQSSLQHEVFSWLLSLRYNQNATEKLRLIVDQREISAHSYIRAFYAFGFVYIPSDTDSASRRLSDQSDEENVHSECATSQENEKEEEKEETYVIKSLTLANSK